MGYWDNFNFLYSNIGLSSPTNLRGFNSPMYKYNLYQSNPNYNYSYANIYSKSKTEYSKYDLKFTTNNLDLKNSLVFSKNYKLSDYDLNTYRFNNSYLYSNSKYSFTPYKLSYNIPTFNKSTFKPTQYRFKRANTGDLQLDLAQNAYSYIGKVNSDRAGNRLFSNGVSQAWCADFVTHVTKQTFGDKLPKSFGSSSVSGLRSWAENNDCYIPMVSSGKQNFLKSNVRVGDIMVEKRNGKSHTGIVKEVASDGSWFKVVEGNSSNKVQEVTHYANSETLSGFISLDRYCA